ncbi:MAG: GntR family transcriptional regulator, partial [Candidatus Puniceispirillaceae bacterium]
MNLTQIKRESVPLHAEVAALLRHQIMSGRLKAGERLPALSELTEKF